jgi:hypothetical protein
MHMAWSIGEGVFWCDQALELLALSIDMTDQFYGAD